jgi:1-acyl-sn-glycerol-3-phosphate acyltransferase
MRIRNAFGMRTLWWLGGAFRFYLRKVQGMELVPKAPFIIAANHQGPMDALFLVAAFMRPIHFIATRTLAEKNQQSLWWWHRFWVFTIGQAIPTGDNGVENSVAVLKKNHLIGIFPEGRIHPKVQGRRIHSGVARIAHRAQVPILPVRIQGSSDVWPITNWPMHPWKLRSVDITIGKPISPPSPGTILSQEEYLYISRQVLHIIQNA